MYLRVNLKSNVSPFFTIKVVVLSKLTNNKISIALFNIYTISAILKFFLRKYALKKRTLDIGRWKYIIL